MTSFYGGQKSLLPLRTWPCYIVVIWHYLNKVEYFSFFRGFVKHVIPLFLKSADQITKNNNKIIILYATGSDNEKNL